MSPLQLEYTWEPAESARGPELRATWAQLRILVDGHVITRVNDERARTVRDSIYVPLYPLAEWIATHWFFMFEEFSVPGKAGYSRRHNLRAAREGYAVPDLEMRPEGDTIRLSWNRFTAGHNSCKPGAAVDEVNLASGSPYKTLSWSAPEK